MAMAMAMGTRAGGSTAAGAETATRFDRGEPVLGLAPLRRMRLADLLVACREERARRQRGEQFRDDFDLELIRRAVVGRDPVAWEAVLDQYRGVLMSWVRRDPAYPIMKPDVEYVAVRALERFWKAIGPERLAQFPDPASLMRYLKMCVHSALLDEMRGWDRVTEELDVETEGGDIEELAVERLAASDLWCAIIRVLDDAAERLVMYCSMVGGLKPAEICQRYPDRFAGIGDVYRTKRTALERLRRSPEICAFLVA
jgi:DNA-directed RNA polymerase specialized sigma24 family protein